MAAATFLILPALENGEAILASPAGSGYETRRVAAADLPSLNVNDPVLILPGQWVRIFETELPKAGRSQQLQMARFAKEDDIANSADALHFALSETQPPRLAVIDNAIMDLLIERMGGLKFKAAYADYDVLSGASAILVIDRAVEPGLSAIDLDWTEESLMRPTDRELAALISNGLEAGESLNLLQGAYRPKSSFNLPRFPAIRVAGLAAASLLALFVWNGVQDRAALAQAEDLRAQTASEYLAATGERAPSNPGRTAAQKLQSGPAPSAGFLDLSTVLFSGLAPMDDTRVDQLRFNAENGTLQLRLIYPDFDAAARVESAIAQAGGRLTTGGVREQNGAFVGEATLSLGGGL